jgi:mRNA-degrading endonuclease RelE of RelBE toxin-antitoxin system
MGLVACAANYRPWAKSPSYAALKSWLELRLNRGLPESAVYDLSTVRQPGTRKLVHGQYLIYYQIREAERIVEVLRVSPLNLAHH